MSVSVKETIETIKKQIQNIDFQPQTEEIGYTVNVADGVAQVIGIPKVQYGEIVRFESGVKGIASSLEQDYTSVVLLQSENSVRQGDEVFREKEFLQAPVGKSLLGRVINALGKPIDGKGDLNDVEYKDIENPSPNIVQRKSINQPLYTGIKTIDSLIPIGKGQRELIIGDRKTGKTSIAIDAIINQKSTHSTDNPVYCVYVAIGQKSSDIAFLTEKLKKHGALKYTTIVASFASYPASIQYLTPYVGCTIGEYFRDNGMHALIIYDDLSKHAVSYRQMSLLLKKPPGREAYPGDIFFVHAKLLERSAQLSDDCGGGSLTAMPIVETQAGDISSYIPTNVISITDGQIFLEEELFYKGQRPAVNIGLSVSRVGSSAQVKAMKQVAAKLKLELAQYRDLESFTAFASDMNQETKDILDYGSKLMESMKQDQYCPIPMISQVISIYAQTNKYTKNIPLEKIPDFEQCMIKYIKKNYPDVISNIKNDNIISPETEQNLKIALKSFVQSYSKEL